MASSPFHQRVPPASSSSTCRLLASVSTPRSWPLDSRASWAGSPATPPGAAPSSGWHRPLWFFYGRLGWEHVLVIQKDPPEDWPEFELPSDLAGILFVRAVGDRDWRTDLRTKLVRSAILP